MRVGTTERSMKWRTSAMCGSWKLNMFCVLSSMEIGSDSELPSHLYGSCWCHGASKISVTWCCPHKVLKSPPPNISPLWSMEIWVKKKICQILILIQLPSPKVGLLHLKEKKSSSVRSSTSFWGNIKLSLFSFSFSRKSGNRSSISFYQWILEIHIHTLIFFPFSL